MGQTEELKKKRNKNKSRKLTDYCTTFVENSWLFA